MTTATTTPRGFQVTCIKCGEADAVVKLNLADVSEFSCSECEEEFTAADVRQFVDQWQAVLAWTLQAPALAD